MRNLFKLIILLYTLCFLISCNHDIMEELEEELDLDEDNIEILYSGNFSGSGRYDVSGSAEIILSEGKKILILKSFSSSSGPDLKVFMSQERSLSNQTNLGDLKALTGTFSYDLPENFELDENGPFVLIYCERFRALFGSAELK